MQSESVATLRADFVELRRRKLADLAGTGKPRVRGLVRGLKQAGNVNSVPSQKKHILPNGQHPSPTELTSRSALQVSVPPKANPSSPPCTKSVALASSKSKAHNSNRQHVVSQRNVPANRALLPPTCPAGRVNANCGSVLASESSKLQSTDAQQNADCCLRSGSYSVDLTGCKQALSAVSKPVLSRKRRGAKQDTCSQLSTTTGDNASGCAWSANIASLSDAETFQGPAAIHLSVDSYDLSSPCFSLNTSIEPRIDCSPDHSRPSSADESAKGGMKRHPTQKSVSSQTDISISHNALLIVVIPPAVMPVAGVMTGRDTAKTSDASVQTRPDEEGVQSKGQKRHCASSISRRERRFVRPRKSSVLRSVVCNPLFVLFDQMWIDWARSRLNSYGRFSTLYPPLNDATACQERSTQCLIEPASSSSRLADAAIACLADTCQSVDKLIRSKCGDLRRIMGKLDALECSVLQNRPRYHEECAAHIDYLNTFFLAQMSRMEQIANDYVNPLCCRVDEVTHKFLRLKAKTAERSQTKSTGDTAIGFNQPPSRLSRDVLEKEVESLRTALQLKFHELSSLRSRHNDALYKLERMSEMSERFNLLQQRNEELRALLELRQHNEQMAETKFSQLLQRCERECREKRRLLSENEQLSYKLDSLQ